MLGINVELFQFIGCMLSQTSDVLLGPCEFSGHLNSVSRTKWKPVEP